MSDIDPRILGSDVAVALDRFRPDGIGGYRAATMPDAPIRATRAEAEDDERAWVEAVTALRARLADPHGSPGFRDGDERCRVGGAYIEDHDLRDGRWICPERGTT